ncbi:MAG: hypothetical protein AAF322_17175, partial [Pseudomonadota bacterium]
MRTNQQGGGAPSMGALGLLAVAVLATALIAAFAYAVVGLPPLIGIDDAAITRNYAENIANGHGFVYYPGGERVEGATSFLWTVALAGVYLIDRTPEALIVAICGALAALGVFSTLSLTTLAARRIGISERAALVAALVGLAASPGYFYWTVFTMMEVALWSATILFLV